MNEKELVSVFVEELSRVRVVAAKSIGWPSVLALEVQGLVIVPAWVPEMVAKLAKLGAAATADSGPVAGEPK